MIRSIILIIIAGLLLILSCFNVLYILKYHSTITKRIITLRITTIIVCVLILLMIVPYVNPNTISVPFEQIACVELKSGTLYGHHDWHTIYEMDYFLFKVSDSAYYKYPNLPSYEGEFAEMDTSKYTYVYTFGAPLESLYYEVWDCEGVPILDFGLSTKWGKAKLSSPVKDNKVYMYRIPKMAIANEENTRRY